VTSHAPKPLLIGTAALVTEPVWNGQQLMRRLGGTVKLGDIIEAVSTSKLTGERLLGILPITSPLQIKGGSFNFGLTVFGSKALSKLPIEFKRALQSRGISSRWVTGKDGEAIAPAAVAKLQLTTKGLDVCIFVDGDMAHIGMATHVQDANAWSLRDYGRPARDMSVGMLPPKLARMMVNLATPLLPLNNEYGREVILDPFCGSGTILMEAALATEDTTLLGSDLQPKQVKATRSNFDWLLEKKILSTHDKQRLRVFVADAQNLSEQLKPHSIDRVVTEGTLGPPLRGHESHALLERNVKEITDLWSATLTALKPLLASKARVVCIWPAFKTTCGIARVDLEPRLTSLGYQLSDPFEGWNVPAGPLLYHRPGQKVMRRIVLLRPL